MKLLPAILAPIQTLDLLKGRPGRAVKVRDFDSIRQFVLRNDKGMEVKLINYGATVTSIMVPDRNGRMADVALGYDSVEGYINAIDRPYFGCTVGRYANRIAGGRFTLDGAEYKLAVNDGENQLHGGVMGFDKVVWEAEEVGPNAVRFSHRSADGDEGYPGNLDVSVTYSLGSGVNELRMVYKATTDKPTVINLTNHTYFNLAGEGSPTVNEHLLMIPARRFLPLDEGMIPTREIRDVAGTPFDFRMPKRIGDQIDDDDEQLQVNSGYNHNYILENNSGARVLAAELYEPVSGRVLEVSTTEPAIQVYSAGFLDGRVIGKSGRPYLKHGAICLEAQHYPDSPNRSDFPSTTLRPGETFKSETTYRFSIRNAPVPESGKPAEGPIKEKS